MHLVIVLMFSSEFLHIQSLTIKPSIL